MPWLWDFKNELLRDRVHEANDYDNAIKRIFEWYINDGKYNLGETENTHLAKCIYSVLWDIPMSYLDDSSLRLLDIDVMNSFWTIYQHAITLEFSDPGTKWYRGKINKGTFNHLLEKYEDYVEVNEKTDKYGDIKKFAQLTHTIGNFTLEPKFWNAGRYKSTKDFWDSTLYFLKAMEVIGFNYKSYVQKFFKQGYCDKSNGYEPIPLWEGCNLPRAIKPPIDKIEHFISNANRIIEQRGKFMVKRLCEKLDMQDLTFYSEKNLCNLSLD